MNQLINSDLFAWIWIAGCSLITLIIVIVGIYEFLKGSNNLNRIEREYYEEMIRRMKE